MPFTHKDWKDDPDTTTPLSAAALEDMEDRLGAYTDSTVAAHTGDASAAHAASAISVTPTGTIAATDAQAALAEVASDAATALSAHTGAATAAHAATAVSFTPNGSIAATTVQAAIQEVRDEATGSGTGLPAFTAVKTGAYTAAAGEFVRADASGGAFTVTLPAGTASQLVGVKKVDTGSNAVAVQVTGGGSIDGDSGGASITSPQFGGIFECVSAGVWLLVGVTSSGGTNGVNGTVWFTHASGSPSAGTGVDGDYSLRTSDSRVFKKVSGAWADQSFNLAGMTNPMTTADDMIVGGASGTPTRVAKGSNNTVWGVNGSGVLGFKADPAGSSRSAREVATAPTGGYENFLRVNARLDSNLAVLTSGRVVGVRGVVIPAGVAINTISFFSGTTAAVTPTNQWACLIDPATSNIVAVSADKTTEAWGTSARKDFTLAATYTPSVETAVIVGLMVAAATVPNFIGLISQTVVMGVAPFTVFNTGLTGQTTPAAVGTGMGGTSAITNIPYCFVS